MRREIASQGGPTAAADPAPGEYFARRSARWAVTYGARSDIGKERSQNEDQYVVIHRQRHAEILDTTLEGDATPPMHDEAYVFVVVDGLGGQAFGKVASEIAARTVWDLGTRESCWPMHVDDEGIPGLGARAAVFVQSIHDTMAERTRERPELEGMGATLTAAYAVARHAFITHVGDSRAYLLRGDTIGQITRDHTVAQRLIEEGIQVEEASALEHVLTNCLGASRQSVAADFHPIRLEAGDALLLCTDGLSGLVEEQEMLEEVRRAEHPQAACDALVSLSLERGGYDNITVVVAEFNERRA